MRHLFFHRLPCLGHTDVRASHGATRAAARLRSTTPSDSFPALKTPLYPEAPVLDLTGDILAPKLEAEASPAEIVDIALSRDQDNPQLIFESMNSTGRELSQADLIRNFILMGLDPAQQKRLYEEHWRPMEVAFGQQAYGTHFDGFMRHYLTLKTGEIPNVRAVYEAFKGHARSPEVTAAGVDTLVADIHTYAGYYCAMALDKAPDRDLAPVFRDLRELKVDVAFPFLLELYDDHARGRLPIEDLYLFTG